MWKVQEKELRGEFVPLWTPSLSRLLCWSMSTLRSVRRWHHSCWPCCNTPPIDYRRTVPTAFYERLSWIFALSRNVQHENKVYQDIYSALKLYCKIYLYNEVKIFCSSSIYLDIQYHNTLLIKDLLLKKCWSDHVWNEIFIICISLLYIIHIVMPRYLGHLYLVVDIV